MDTHCSTNLLGFPRCHPDVNEYPPLGTPLILKPNVFSLFISLSTLLSRRLEIVLSTGTRKIQKKHTDIFSLLMDPVWSPTKSSPTPKLAWKSKVEDLHVTSHPKAELRNYHFPDFRRRRDSTFSVQKTSIEVFSFLSL